MKLHKAKILHIDDQSEICQLMKSILQDQVKAFYSAQNALNGYEMYRAFQPDIILLDINLPDEDGITLARKIRKNDLSVKIIMVTGYIDIEKLLLASDLKLTKYILKPFFNDDLFDALHQALEEIEKFTITSNKIIYLKDSFYWNIETTTLHNQHSIVKLTPKETSILDLLFTNRNHTILYETFLIKIWNDYENTHINTLKTMIKNIRKKLPLDTIENVYGIGFKLFI